MNVYGVESSSREPTERARWLASSVIPHEPALRRWLERKQMRGIDVDDVIQDTYATMAALVSVAQIRNPKAYVYQTAQSLALARLRRSRVVCIQPVADIERFASGAALSPEQIIADQEELHRAAAAIARLPRRCREVFVMRKIDGLSQREVAARMSITEGTVEKQIHKATEWLMKALGRGGKYASRTSNADTLTGDM